MFPSSKINVAGHLPLDGIKDSFRCLSLLAGQCGAPSRAGTYHLPGFWSIGGHRRPQAIKVPDPEGLIGCLGIASRSPSTVSRLVTVSNDSAEPWSQSWADLAVLTGQYSRWSEHCGLEGISGAGWVLGWKGPPLNPL